MVDKNTIRNWFRTDFIPNQAQFWEVFESYFHKDEKIPITSIDMIDTILAAKAEKEAYDAHLIAPGAHTELFDEKVDKTAKNAALGFAGLDADSRMNNAQMPKSITTDKYICNGGLSTQYMMRDGSYTTGLESNNMDYIFATNAYGMRYDSTAGATEVERIGNYEMHQTLPVHSLMRRCLLSDTGVVNTYLNPTNANLKLDGSAADLTGASGQFMVEIPEHYERFQTEGTVCNALISLTPFINAVFVPKAYVSAVKATVQRSTSKLSSVINTTADYRGGNNNASLDAAANTQLGKPATLLSRIDFEACASNRGFAWGAMDYQMRKTIYWLITIEYANRNHQAAFNGTLDTAGNKQGALGMGPTDIIDSEWSTFNGYYPLFNCGTTVSSGNATVSKPVTLNNFPTAGSSRITQTTSYRGIENFFGDIWEWTSGVNIKTNNGVAKVFVKNNGAANSSTGYLGYRFAGNFPIANGYIKTIQFGPEGDLFAKDVVGGSATTYFSDYYYQLNPATETIRGLLFGGNANDGSIAGSAHSYSSFAPSDSYSNVGSRLCFRP